MLSMFFILSHVSILVFIFSNKLRLSKVIRYGTAGISLKVITHYFGQDGQSAGGKILFSLQYFTTHSCYINGCKRCKVNKKGCDFFCNGKDGVGTNHIYLHLTFRSVVFSL
jgi:hypothetical protein